MVFQSLVVKVSMYFFSRYIAARMLSTSIIECPLSRKLWMMIFMLLLLPCTNRSIMTAICCFLIWINLFKYVTKCANVLFWLEEG